MANNTLGVLVACQDLTPQQNAITLQGQRSSIGDLTLVKTEPSPITLYGPFELTVIVDANLVLKQTVNNTLNAGQVLLIETRVRALARQI